MKTFKSLRNLAMFGALFAATHGLANGSHEVVSEKGVTSIVERIDFPGQIKDVIPAGDKYIIHADPIASLKDSAAKDALFVMEKDKTGTAFGRTFSEPIHSVAYVPGLDIAVWSYDAGNNVYNTNLFEMVQGQSALKSAGSNKVFVPDKKQRRIYPGVDLFASSSNVITEVSSGLKRRAFSVQDGKYTVSAIGNDNSISNDKKVLTSNEQGGFVAIPRDVGRLIVNEFNPYYHTYDIPDMGTPISMAAVSVNPDQHENYIFLGYENGGVRASFYSAGQLGEFSQPKTILQGPISSMTPTTNHTVKTVSTNSNQIVEITPSLDIQDTIIPNPSETGYRKVITDKGDTLLLSNTQSNCFYRIKTR